MQTTMSPPEMILLPFSPAEPLLFSAMFSSDLLEICELEKRCFSIPWSYEAYRREVQENRNAYYYVVRSTDYTTRRFNMPPLIGYGGYWLLGEEAHITTIAVHPDWRRHHLGEWILLNMLTSIQAKGAELAMLEVRAGNQAAINLYTRLGFQEVGVRKRYYEDNHEDALLLTLDNIQYDFVWRDLSRRRNSVACEIRLKFGPSLEERIEMGERLGYDAEF